MNTQQESMEAVEDIFNEEVECGSCGWKGREMELGCDRGGHHFTCPTCKGNV